MLVRNHNFVGFIAVLLIAGCGGGSNSSSNSPGNPPAPPLTGLNARPSNLSCVAPERGSAGPVDIVDAFPTLGGFDLPTKLLVEPVQSPRWFVLEKNGRVRVFDPGSPGGASTFIDLQGVVSTSASEGGLLGMAFHPNYPDTPEVFLSYTIEGVGGPRLHSIISRFVLDSVVAPGGGTVEQQIIRVDQDFANHNGGEIAFGPDGYLYIGLGDGGSGGDPNNRAQDTTRLLGSMLRIDVAATGADYQIPANNPFGDQPKCGPAANANNCPEIYAWGLRNPWRWSFDSATGDLWAGDVGQNQWEEIDRIDIGGNYGWRCYEGEHAYNLNGCSAGSYQPPVSEYSHANGNASVTGGMVYRGTAIPSLVGRYVFADFSSGRLWALQPDGSGGYTNQELADTSTNPSSFGIDQDKELYITDYSGGRIMRLVSAGAGVDSVPETLSASGCVGSADITQAYAGLVPYGINAAFWSDNAAKDRYIGLPDNTSIAVDAEDDWVFPPGTVLVKNFRLNGRLVETRHLMRHPDGTWAGYTYEWNPDETEATRVRGGKIVDVDGQDWVFPDEAECLQCHTAAAGFALGPETAQMNRNFTYASTGRTHDQLETLDAISMFDTPIGDTSTLPGLPDPEDGAAGLNERARAYLHTNCAQCHRPAGPTPVDLDLRFTTALVNTNTCDVVPGAGDLGLAMARIIAPGDASRSVLVERVSLRNQYGMPPLASTIVDQAGVDLLTDWVDSLVNCN